MKVVLFDLDGTLVKAGGAGRKALNRAVNALYGVPDVCSRFSLMGRMDRQNFTLASFHATGRKPGPAEVRRVEEAYLRFLPSEVRRAVRSGRYEEIPGCSRLLRALARRRGVMAGLGTGNVRQGAAIKLGPSGFGRYFAFGGYGRDGVSRAQMLRMAVRRAERLAGRAVRRREVFVIGDTPRDVLAGKRSGYRTAAVTGGFGDPEAIRRAKPELTLPDYRDLKAWLDWIGV